MDDLPADVVDGVSDAVADLPNWLKKHSVPVFSDTAARDAAIPSPTVGRLAHIASNDSAEGLTEHNSGGEWRKPWNMPWGEQAAATRTTTQSGIGTSLTDLTDLTVTFDAVGNRVYHVFVKLMMEKLTNGGEGRVVLANASSVTLEQLIYTKMNAADFHTEATLTRVTGISGPTTLKLRGQSGTATSLSIRNDLVPGRLIVVDAGPVGAPA